MPNFEMQFNTRQNEYIGTIPFFDLQGEFRMNEPDQIRFKTSSVDISSYLDIKLLRAGLTECSFFRDGAKIFAGPIWEINVSSKERVMSFAAEDVSSYLKQRAIVSNLKYTNKVIGSIAWDLINRAQLLTDGDLGITLGTSISSSWPKDSVSYAAKTRENLFKAVEKLSSGTTGFDWEITPEREFNIYYPRIRSKANILLEYGGAIKNYAVKDMGKYVYNDVMIKGGKKVVSSAKIDTVSRALFGLRQYVESKTSLKTMSKVDAYANQVLSLRKNPRLIPQLTVDSTKVNPFDGDISYGQLVNTHIDDGWVQFDGEMRCSGWQLTVNNQSTETIVLYVNDTREIEDDGL